MLSSFIVIVHCSLFIVVLINFVTPSTCLLVHCCCTISCIVHCSHCVLLNLVLLLLPKCCYCLHCVLSWQFIEHSYCKLLFMVYQALRQLRLNTKYSSKCLSVDKQDLICNVVKMAMINSAVSTAELLS